MIPFVIVADLRTGSTLLHSSLDRHPQVRCYGEVLHTDDLPDNGFPGVDRRVLTGREVVRRAFAAEVVLAAGFRAMIDHPFPSTPQWSDAWDALRETIGLRVIVLNRRDRLAQYASMLVAQRTGAWHPSPGEPILRPENRPTVTIDPEAFRRWSEERNRLYVLRREQLRDKPSLDLDYESLASDWAGTIRAVQEFLSVDPLDLGQEKQVQETRPLSEVVENYGELILGQLAGIVSQRRD
jgi:LPS sulfotransferase NodH